MYGLDIFSGIGGITKALEGYVRPVAYCENDRYAQCVLLSRMGAGDLPRAPIWDDVRTLKPEDLPAVDIIYGGFPCQDISIAGRGEGLAGKRSGLFFEIVRLVSEIRPRFVFLENVPAIRFRGGDVVAGELARLGYDCRWDTLSAANVGANHIRERWWLLAHTALNGLGEVGMGKSSRSSEVAHAASEFRDGTGHPRGGRPGSPDCGQVRDSSIQRFQDGRGAPLCGQRESFEEPKRSGWWATEPNVGRVAHELSSVMDVHLSGGINETVRILRCCACKTEMGKRQGRIDLQESPLLWLQMLQRCQTCTKRVYEKVRAKKGAKALSHNAGLEVRNLRCFWGQAESESQGREHTEQRTNEYSNLLLPLPRQGGLSLRDMGTKCSRVNRLRALGNGVVPLQAREAFERLMGLK